MFLYGPHTINGQYVACQFQRYNIYREIFCGVIIWYADGDQDEWDLPWRHCGLVYCMALFAMLLRTVMHNGYLSGTAISPSINKGDGMNMALITGCPQRERLVYTPYIPEFYVRVLSVKDHENYLRLSNNLVTHNAIAESYIWHLYDYNFIAIYELQWLLVFRVC